MLKSVLYLLVGLAVGFAIARTWSSDSGQSAAPAGLQGVGAAATLAQLDDRFAAERRARESLAAEVADLRSAVEALAEPDSPDRKTAGPPRASSSADLEAAGAEPPQPIARFGRRASPEQRLDRLVEAGFSTAQAQWIEERTEQLSVEAMQARYEAQLGGDAPGVAVGRFSPDATLRAELGDADYERYLSATGRPTSVGVTEVLASSAAERAGLLPGDEIYSYDGQRVFNTRDLNQVVLDGESGQPVVVDIVRDGQPLQLVMPRGPLGVASGRFGGRTGGFGQ